MIYPHTGDLVKMRFIADVLLGLIYFPSLHLLDSA